jgi:hypothetical protein
VRVGIDMMDSVQRSVAMDAANHRPGWRVPPRVDHVQDDIETAHRDYCRWLRNAHKTPAVTVADAKPSKIKRGDASAAYREYCQYLTDAHKQGRQP